MIGAGRWERMTVATRPETVARSLLDLNTGHFFGWVRR